MSIRRRLFFLLIIGFLLLSAKAALPSFTWQTGQLTYWNNQVIDGELTYNWLTEMVLLRRPDGSIATLTTDQVHQFSWFDYSVHKQRLFKAIVRGQGDRSSSFYEVCLNGSLTVVRRLRKPHGLFERVFSHPVNYTDRPTIAQNADYFDYFVHDDARLLPLDRFELDIYEPLMGTYHQPLATYVRVHNINNRSIWGRLVLIDRYNTLVKKDDEALTINSFSPSGQ